MEDLLQICALAVADYAPWTCVRCESINAGANHCEVCDEPRYGRNIDVEDEVFDIESEPVVDVEDEVIDVESEPVIDVEDERFDVEAERFEYIQLALL